MMQIKQHVPNFSSGIKPAQQEFHSIAGLLNIDFVAKWEEFENFCRFSLAKIETNDNTDQYNLMAELEDGKVWWPVGIITGENIETLNLPMWEPKP